MHSVKLRCPIPVLSKAQRPVTRSFDVFFDLRLIKRWVNTREAGDFKRYCAHNDVIVMHITYQGAYEAHFFPAGKLPFW